MFLHLVASNSGSWAAYSTNVKKNAKSKRDPASKPELELTSS
jgi:hypothetical protein